MWKWTKRILVTAIIAWGSYTTYDYYRAGFHTLPDMPAGAFQLSYKNGLRAILVDVPNEKETRRYLGFPRKVPFYLEDTWSFCTSPDEKEKTQITEVLKSRDWPGERIEGVCKIKVDNEVVLRGFITSVPKL